jgi:hypothetical protein
MAMWRDFIFYSIDRRFIKDPRELPAILIKITLRLLLAGFSILLFFILSDEAACGRISYSFFFNLLLYVFNNSVRDTKNQG